MNRKDEGDICDTEVDCKLELDGIYLTLWGKQSFRTSVLFWCFQQIVRPSLSSTKCREVRFQISNCAIDRVGQDRAFPKFFLALHFL